MWFDEAEISDQSAIKIFLWWLVLLVFLVSCASTLQEEPLSWEVAFFSLGAKVQFGEASPIQRLNAFNADGVMVAQLDFPTPPRQIELLYFEWREGEVYRFEVTLLTGNVDIKMVTAPRSWTQGSLEISVPYGAATESDRVGAFEGDQKALVLQGSEMTATVLVRNGNVPATFDLQLCLPTTLTVVRVPEDWKSETIGAETCLSTTGVFKVASEVWYRELVLKTSEVNGVGGQEISGTVRFRADDGRVWEQQATVVLQVSTIPEIADRLSIESIVMPTDSRGAADSRRRSDTIYYARPFFRWFGTSPTDAFEPIAYQTVRLRNEGEAAIHVVVSSGNIDIDRGETVPFLAPPETANGGINRSVAFASLPAGIVTEVPLPIYFHPMYIRQGKVEQASPGAYRREITVQVWGSDATVLRERRPLHLIVPNQQALLVSLSAIVCSSIGFVFVFWFHKRIFAGFTTKQIIVIALFGATIFVGVMVPSTLFLNLIRAVLGPLSVLLTGLINETLYYALLTALLIYISGDCERTTGARAKHVYQDSYNLDAAPRAYADVKWQSNGSGVIFLVSAVRLLLSGVTFGLFTPMAIVYTGTSVLLLETGFLFVRGRSILAWAVVLGLCDAIAVYVDFQLSMLFYRLFYAGWYIVLRIVIEGFVYTFIGVLLGARLGWGLWQVAD